MLTMLIRTAITITFFICFGSLRAQHNAISALRKIHNSYNSGTAIRFTGSMKMYAKNDPHKITDQLQSSYTLKNNNFRCSIGPVSMLVNDDYYVSVNNSEKMIMLGRKKDLPSLAGNPVLNLAQLEKWLSEKNILAAVSVKGATTLLQLTDITGISGFTTCNIEFNTGSGYMNSVVMENVANSEAGIMVLEIRYSKPVPAINASFSEKAFLSIADNKVQLSEAYRNYQLISQL